MPGIRPISTPAPAAASRIRSASLSAPSRAKAGSKEPSIIAAPFSPTYGASRAPPATASRKSRGSRPRSRVRASDSATPSTTVSTQAFAASLRRVPAPASPTHMVRLPIASSTGATRARRSSAPEASTTSAPSSAGLRVPSTGASTYATPSSSARATSRSVPATPTVLCCSQTVSAPSAGPASVIALATLSTSYSMVSTMSAPSTASRIEPATVATSASGSALAAVRFQTRTGSPAAAMLRAIPAPMVPVPRTATVGELMSRTVRRHRAWPGHTSLMRHECHTGHQG